MDQLSSRADLCASSGEAGAWLEPVGWSPDLLKARVYERLLLDVILGVLPPDSRLDEQVLADRYDAGLAGVREALGRLSLEGLVIRKARAGTTVAPLDLAEARQTLEMRRLIEPYGAALAAENATDQEIAVLGHVFDGAEAAVRAGDRRALVLMDQNFHCRVARASGNPTLARMLAPLLHKAGRFWARSIVSYSEARNKADIEAHRLIVERIADRDGPGARAAVLKLLGVWRSELGRGLAKATAEPRSLSVA